MNLEESALANTLIPDTLTPSQWADRCRPLSLDGEAKMYLEILSDAVDCLRYRDIQTARGQKLAREAARWLETDHQDENGQPYVTVGMCCEVLGIDLEWLRRGLRHYIPAKRLPRMLASGFRARVQPSPTPRRANLTPADATRLLDMYHAGATYAQIRHEIAVSNRSIYRIVKAAGPRRCGASITATQNESAPMIQMKLEGITT